MSSPDYADGEVLGVDVDGKLIQWDRQGEVAYNCGETLEEFGITNLTTVELARVLSGLSK